MPVFKTKPIKTEPLNGMANMATNLPSNSSGGDINILILGETGVGKSTFINAFANYLTHATLDEAEKHKLINLIPCSFSVPNEQFEVITVKSGQDDNENLTAKGASQTQSCRSYLIKTSQRTVRLIDSPGIGDTRGIEQDKKNFENILAFVAQYPILHGILILLKPNNARLTVTFRFCVQELLCHLHKNAAKNMIFVFTNSRSTFYKPGDTLDPLKQLLAEVKKKDAGVDIKLSKETMYCTDNESYRFLVAKENGIKFDVDEKESFTMSWKKSAVQCREMVDYAANRPPHSVDDTISVNEARRMIIALSRPLGDVAQNIQVNIALINDQQQKIKLAGDDIHQLRGELYVPVTTLQQIIYDEPRTVCASKRCIRIYQNEGFTPVTDYPQVCHDPCYLTHITKEILNNPEIQDCYAINETSLTCNVCSCGWDVHMHIYYKNEPVESQMIDESTQLLLNDKSTARQAVKDTLKLQKQKVKDLEEEQKSITSISAQFAHFLKTNAITPYNDATRDYINHLIENEKTKCDQSEGTYAKDVHDGLQRMLRDYDAEVKLLESNMASKYSGTNGMTTDYIKKAFQQLFALPINGKQIEQMIATRDKALQQEFVKVREKVYTI